MYRLKKRSVQDCARTSIESEIAEIYFTIDATAQPAGIVVCFSV